MEIKYKPDEFEIKLMLLYIIKNLKTSATYTLLDYIVKDTADLNYFELQKYIDTLTGTGDIKELRTDDENVIYSITDTGEETVQFFAEKLPYTIRETLNNKVKQINKKHKASNVMKADFYALNANEYGVKFNIKENGLTLLNLEFYAGGKERAKSLTSYINKNAAQFYMEITSLMNNKIDENEKNKKDDNK